MRYHVSLITTALVTVVAMMVAPMVARTTAAIVLMFMYGAGAKRKATKNQQGQNATNEEGHGENLLRKGEKELRMFLLKR